MTTLTSEANAAHALMMLLAEHPTLPQPEFELHEYVSDAGEPEWGAVLVVGDSLTHFEQWRATLDLDPVFVDFSACSHGACLTAIGDFDGVSVELFAVINVPAK
ncbi:hypothetical protein AB0I39_01555 [Kitasatospora purpeofusca]|uniref:hypothetical protein n=1 Tax=Kitasatospora purpeofusca TaxID=67352 RepID=UPI0033FCECD7